MDPLRSALRRPVDLSDQLLLAAASWQTRGLASSRRSAVVRTRIRIRIRSPSAAIRTDRRTFNVHIYVYVPTATTARCNRLQQMLSAHNRPQRQQQQPLGRWLVIVWEQTTAVC